MLHGLENGLDHDEYVALARGVQNPKVQISDFVHGLQLEDNVAFYVEMTVEDILTPITIFSVRNNVPHIM